MGNRWLFNAPTHPRIVAAAEAEAVRSSHREWRPSYRQTNTRHGIRKQMTRSTNLWPAVERRFMGTSLDFTSLPAECTSVIITSSNILLAIKIAAFLPLTDGRCVSLESAIKAPCQSSNSVLIMWTSSSQDAHPNTCRYVSTLASCSAHPLELLPTAHAAATTGR